MAENSKSYIDYSTIDNLPTPEQIRLQIKLRCIEVKQLRKLLSTVESAKKAAEAHSKQVTWRLAK